MGLAFLRQGLHLLPLGPSPGQIEGLEPPFQADPIRILSVIHLAITLQFSLCLSLAIALLPLPIVVDGVLEHLVPEALLVALHGEGHSDAQSMAGVPLSCNLKAHTRTACKSTPLKPKC